MHRKEFLSKLAITGSLFALQRKNELFAQAEPTSEPTSSLKQNTAKTAIVLGGGLSGLYSAYLLKQSGYQVTLIERGDRLGGRIFTFQDKNLGIVQDLGGEWIGEGQADIKTLVKQLGLTLKDSPLSENFHLRNSENPLLNLSKSSLETIEKVIDLHKSLGESQRQGLDKINFASYIRYQGVSEDEARSLSEIYRLLTGADLNAISSEDMLHDLESPESSLRPKFFVSGGSEQIIQRLLLAMGKEVEILSSETAVKVSQTKNAVTVDLLSGRSVRANIMICTIPAQNVLDIKWLPNLPKDMTYSALRMQMGRISKNIVLLKRKETTKPFLQLSETPMQAMYVSSEEAIGENVLALTSITQGDRSTLWERSSESQKKGLARLSLAETKMADSGELSDQSFVFHSFQKNTGLRGFVSLFPPGSFGIKEVWKEPFERVFFAGEHLGRHSGSMDGALSSAIQAVSRI
ncbi:NAD(P)-binding Rossmann-like domain protein [Leptospira ryugenii]|uniref:NAD(P)-binding Rossmann-like domain protein n=1 Tax=Leptospira ryugenii TaxID=1917863 RepID=A0A2P2DV89_9LEPT|nr:NAD(P)/FAD-dependent oxidoreductase [Leptospira ryugenii]GBF48568.1 NAD(P)-binding Rossmann-like domain protein [Leptospira ryugenii]